MFFHLCDVKILLHVLDTEHDLNIMASVIFGWSCYLTLDGPQRPSALVPMWPPDGVGGPGLAAGVARLVEADLHVGFPISSPGHQLSPWQTSSVRNY